VGETAADTARELDALRGETERLLDALEGRARQALDVQRQVDANRPLALALGAGAALVAVLTVLLLWYRSYRRAQEARRPINRLRRGAAAVRDEASTRARRVGRAIRGEPAEADEAAAREQVKEQSVSLPQRLAGAAAAAATMALVDQFTRWLAKQQTTGVQHSQQPPDPAPSPLTASPSPASPSEEAAAANDEPRPA
jgi:type II secretory pathway component PulM